jgi:hypothetical protein
VRPANIQTIRDRVARLVIRSLPKDERRKSLKLRRSGRLVEQAEDEMSHGNPFSESSLAKKGQQAQRNRQGATHKEQQLEGHDGNRKTESTLL